MNDLVHRLLVIMLLGCGSSTSTPAPRPLEPAPAVPADAAAAPGDADPDDIPILPTDSPERAEAKRKINEVRRERDRLERESQGGSATP